MIFSDKHVFEDIKFVKPKKTVNIFQFFSVLTVEISRLLWWQNLRIVNKILKKSISVRLPYGGMIEYFSSFTLWRYDREFQFVYPMEVW